MSILSHVECQVIFNQLHYDEGFVKLSAKSLIRKLAKHLINR